MRVPFRRSAESEEQRAQAMAEMTLLDHLKELRKRLIWSVLAVVAGAMIIFTFQGRVLHFLIGPYCEFQLAATPSLERCELITTAPVEAFSTVLTVSGYGGLLLALPVVLYHLGRFVMPGLYPNEKRMLVPFGVASLVLLGLGVASGWILMPRTLAVLQGFGDDSFTPLYRPSEYFGFFVKMLVAFGFAAEFPLILIFLQLVGVLKPDQLASNRRIAIVAVVALGAIITPTGDPFNLAIVSVPMYFFYEVSIIIGRLLLRRRGAEPPVDAEPVG